MIIPPSLFLPPKIDTDKMSEAGQKLILRVLVVGIIILIAMLTWAILTTN